MAREAALQAKANDSLVLRIGILNISPGPVALGFTTVSRGRVAQTVEDDSDSDGSSIDVPVPSANQRWAPPISAILDDDFDEQDIEMLAASVQQPQS